MKIWREKNPVTFTPPAHFGGLKVANFIPLDSERFTLTEGEGVLFEPKDPHYTINEGDRESVSLVITIKHQLPGAVS